MRALIDRIFPVNVFSSSTDQDRARLAYSVLVVIMLGLLVTGFFASSSQGPSIIPGLISRTFHILLIIVAMVMGVATYVLLRRGNPYALRWGVQIVFFVGAVIRAADSGFTDGEDPLVLLVFTVMGLLFSGERGVFHNTIIALITLLIGHLRHGANYPDDMLGTAALVTISTIIIGMSFAMVLYLRIIRRQESRAVGAVSEERYNLASLTTQIATGVLRRTELQDTLNSAIEEIRDKYPRAYHVQIFLVDEARRTARLAASTGDVGKMLLARQHSLPVGSVSVIGQVTSKNEAVIARSGSTNTVHKRNEFLPETVVEAAFPLRSGETVIGALDMQSKFVDAFPDEQQTIFQALADNIAIAIDNARLLEQAQARVRENQRLTEQAQIALNEVQRLNRQITADSWESYVEEQSTPGMTIDMDTEIAIRHADFTPALTEAIKTGRLVQQPTSDSIHVAVPLMVRGQSIGGLEFELEGNEPLEADMIEVIEAVSERLGLAAEGVRLFEESRRSAHREATVNEISGRLQSTNSINTVLSEAARSIQETLGAQRVAIRLGQPPTPRNGTGDKRG